MVLLQFLAASSLLTSLLVSHLVAAMQKQGEHCSITRSGNDLSAGEPSEQIAECKYNQADDTFYQQISWKPPPPGGHLNVTSYMLKVLYGKNWMLCFHFQPNVGTFRFDASKGFRRGRVLRYAVLPMPVRRITRSRLEHGIQCPPQVRLKPIANKYIIPGSNTTFECVFATGKIWLYGEPYFKPVLNFTVEWYFSPDFDCKSNRRILIQNSEHFMLSNEGRTLKVVHASPSHEGCYQLHVKHASGSYYYGASAKYRERYDVLQEHSYLYMNNTKYIALNVPPVNGYFGIKTQLFVALAVGAGLFVVISFAIMLRLCFKKRYFKLLAPSPEQPVMKVYISHAFEDPADVHTLLKFASVLQSFNVDVVLDVCSEVQINMRGGLSRWVPGNIRGADKIVVVLTQGYADMLQRNAVDTEPDGTLCKIHAEYNFISNIMHNNLQKSNRILLVSKGVTPNKFPSLFENKIFYDFPKNLTSAWEKRDGLDSCSKDIVEALLERSI